MEEAAGEHPRGSAGRNSFPGAHLRSACPSTETNDRSAGRANGEKQRQNAIAITFLPAIAAFHSAKCLSLKIKELDARSRQPVSRAMLGAKHGGAHAFSARTLRHRLAAHAALEMAMTAGDPQSWLQIADAWDQLAKHSERSELPTYREDRTRSTGGNAD